MATAKEPPSTSFSHVDTFQFNARAVPFLYRNRIQSISYACHDMIRTWNWKTGQVTDAYAPLHEGDVITAIEELCNGKLIVGTKSGCIYQQKKKSWLYHCSSCLHGNIGISRLMVTGPAHILYKLENDEKALLNISNGHKINFGRETRLTKYREDVIVSFSDGQRADVKSVYNLNKSIHSHLNEGFSDMRVEKEQFILLEHKDKTVFTIWDVENICSVKAPLNSAIHTDQFHTLILIDYTTFIVPDWNGSVFLKKMTYNERRSKWYLEKSKFAGMWEVTSMIKVDDCIMYATVPSWSGIHVFNEDLRLLYTSREHTCNGKSYPVALETLGKGYVAIQFGESISVVKRKKYNKRLLIGEGDFSYTEALVKKHSFLARAIVATELKKRDEIEDEKRLERLESIGVELHFDIDAQWLHERFASRQFKRIHWNCPYGDSAFSMSQGAFKNVIINFFNSCSKIQSVGDRVYVALMQEHNGYWMTRQKENPIVLGSLAGGYVLIGKRVFGSERYPGYEHRTTDGDAYYSFYNNEMREFVFQKVSRKQQALRKSQFLYHDNAADCYFDCDTDNDSSCYEDSDEE